MAPVDSSDEKKSGDEQSPLLPAAESRESLDPADGSGDEGAEDEVADASGANAGRPGILICGLKLLSPLDVHFSQGLIRPEFQDGKMVDNSISGVTFEKRDGAPSTIDPVKEGEAPAPAGGQLDEVAGLEGSPQGEWWLMKHGFPTIEVIRWRCKLRNPDGTPKVNAAGAELYSNEEWYTMDNRRLYCLQQAAVNKYPAQVRCVVQEVQQTDGSSREFRKFRTTNLGRSVRIGHREADPDLPIWCWREKAGLPPEEPQEGHVLVRPRKRRGGNERRWSGNNRYGRGGDKNAQKESWDLPMNAALFVLVYIGLRAVLFVAKKFLGTGSAPELSAAAAKG